MASAGPCGPVNPLGRIRSFKHGEYVTQRRTYSAIEVERIRTAYRQIFPKLNDSLAAYWDLGSARKRDWSFLTTNFHEVDYEGMRSLHADVEALQSRYFSAHAGKAGQELKKLCEDTGAALRDLAEKHQSGLSIGICPWTDHGLLQTYSPEKKRVTIIVAHDWYPVVPLRRHPFDSPLWVSGLHALEERKTMRYVEGAPGSIYDGSSVFLFVNLVPDYRPPGADVVGKLKNYDPWRVGFTAMVEALSERFDDMQVISWGSPVWTQLRKQVSSNGSGLDVMAYAKSDSHQGKYVIFEAGKVKVPYLPLAHPSFSPNYRNKEHWKHVVGGYQALGLGQPGPGSPLEWGEGALRIAAKGHLPDGPAALPAANAGGVENHLSPLDA